MIQKPAGYWGLLKKKGISLEGPDLETTTKLGLPMRMRIKANEKKSAGGPVCTTRTTEFSLSLAA